MWREWSKESEEGGEKFIKIKIWERERGRKRVIDIEEKIEMRIDEKKVEIEGKRIVKMMMKEVMERNKEGIGRYMGKMRYREVKEKEW